MEILAAILTFPTFLLASLYVTNKIMFWGDDHPSHPGKFGAFLVAVLWAFPFAAAGSYFIYTQI